MRKNWLFSTDLDGGEYSYILPLAPLLSHNFGGHLVSQFGSLMDNSLHQSRFLYVPGSMAVQETLNCMSKLAGTLLFWFTSASSSNLSRQISGSRRPGRCKSSAKVKHIASTGNITDFCFNSRSKGESSSPVDFGKISGFLMRFLHREAEKLQSFPVFSFANALVPPLDNLSSKVLAVPMENDALQLHGSLDPRPCEVGNTGCSDLLFPDLNWTRPAVEPKTGIEFPIVLDKLLYGKNKSRLTSEVLVGTGSRTMTIIRIKSLKVYAFGFYVHPNSICEKLGHKYASIPMDELKKHDKFYNDLLREDIDMTVRLVINCSGMKINTVKDAFQKSLRNRLLKTNPNTDYRCLSTFGSFFNKDIPLPAGTTVDFRQTAEGQLITEIGGKQIGAVHSKDLCRAFFDMYIGDVPVSQQTKEEIGKNIADIIRKCQGV